ncbi:hypothetical protein [Haloferula sp. A504]|uniref:hypothetical protein n=1 Tax=Haloferula sp. A504 TaxID=3373601 RepID=UPI0031C8659D|nr:hypothetical protein [Verrucomicrobiaceae bacterium E54]
MRNLPREPGFSCLNLFQSAMKIIPILLLSALLIPPAFAQKPGKGRKPNHRAAWNQRDAGERGAMREEQLLDHLDTHKWKKDPEATDKRPSNLVEYHNHTYKRIVRLLHHGSITEENGQIFKVKHTTITQNGKQMRADGELTEEERAELRGALDDLNDEINAALEESEKASQRTPILNHAQHRFEEKIEFGERSGRLSSGEASRLKRDLAKLNALEEKAKAGGLSTREREKLFEEAAELARELNEELRD